MSLTSQLSNDFDAAVRRRGADYFRTGRVRIDSAHPLNVVATVRGSGKSPYTVELQREDGRLIASCTCRYFDREPCKHVWAVILAASARGLLEGSGSSRRIELLSSLDREEDPFFDADIEDCDLDETREWDVLRGEDAEGARHRQPAHARATATVSTVARKSSRRGTAATWRKQLARLNSGAASGEASGDIWPSTRELLYVIDVEKTREDGELHVEVCFRDLKMEGGWSKPKTQYLRRDWLEQLPEPRDRKILALLAGAAPQHPSASYFPGGYDATSLPFRYRLFDAQALWLLPELCQSGRCRLRLPGNDSEEDEQRWQPVQWDGGEPWRLELQVQTTADREHYELTGTLRRDELTMDLSSVVLASGGVLFTHDRAVPCEPPSARQWIALLREHGPLRVPAAQSEDFLIELLRQPELPRLVLPEELRYEEIAVAPRPRLLVRASSWRSEQLRGELAFDYDGVVVPRGEPGRAVLQGSRRRVLIRDPGAELAAVERLQRLGWRWPVPNHLEPQTCLELHPRHLSRVVRELTLEGWHVEAQGQVYRAPGQIHIQVSSGIDWFELHGQVQFGATHASLPELLAAVRRGGNTVKLDDGTVGLLPEEWLKKYGLLAGLGTPHHEHLRFRSSQVALLDALLDEHPQAQCDEVFSRARDQLKRFTGIQPAQPPAGFCGQLRPYQQEGLGWMHFLRQFGFGGCLADDMGLGKTVQVLALLEARRELRNQTRGTQAPIGPSLLVMPKSLIFNWKQEAARFAPRLRVLDHTGQLRQKGSEHVADYDVVLTTYGTLRNDVVDFKDVRFDYVILDESQAIKNADSVSAKAVRLLQADHRLALSGTPIENHLGELWSLFEFLNPGMLGAASVLQLTRGAERNPDHETRRLLAQALRPFLLRRTKSQVIKDLPPKVEQTLYCELDSKQRRLYDELREHYRQGLMSRIEREGLERSKIQILEALLRLRQAAIHPGLLDKERCRESSAKLDILVPRLKEVIEEGHKTLVFSQFTGMLSILREHLQREGITFEYLDGKTADRAACVERFQNDPQCRLFLISLKAGGVGLNLTAAQYVFLLDPWWNPAVEAQAIDRAHRIGQTRQVFAYRLIARDTVEEKVLELQSTKRELADAILSEDNSLIRNLGKEDLQLLLS